MEQTLKDEEILKLSLEDPSYFSILVDKYQIPFLRKTMGILRNREEAEDIVQETFAKIYRYGHRFKKEDGIEFKSWAYKILMNTSFTHYQKIKKGSANVEYLDPLLYEDTPEENQDFATIQDAKAAVAAVIDKMPEHLARVLKLYYLEDKSYADICKTEKISIPTLKMRLFRSKRLFEKLSADLDL
ncbi:MAG: RNA polymerase sigma factor [Candidatus Harrisonbacteria bacterium]|nr:RNA polymerase sigma factor [Candidatus Harrisonbacteria bacterium]